MDTRKHIAKQTAHALILLLCAAGLVACGGGGGSVTPGTGGLAGKYVMDVDRTIADGPSVDEATAAALREQFRPESYEVDLRTDGTFRLDVSVGVDFMRVEGTWGQGPDGSWIKTGTVNGDAQDADMPVMGEFETVGETVVLNDGGQRIFLKKQP